MACGNSYVISVVTIENCVLLYGLFSGFNVGFIHSHSDAAEDSNKEELTRHLTRFTSQHQLKETVGLSKVHCLYPAIMRYLSILFLDYAYTQLTIYSTQ